VINANFPTENQGAVGSVLAEHAAAIRALRSRIASDVAEIGCRLVKVKSIVGYGNWLPWIDKEFGWSEDTAERFIRVHEFIEGLSDSATVRNLILTLPVSSVYLLAAPSTPDEARAEILERAQAGEPVSVAETKRTIDRAKGRKPRDLKGVKIHREMKLGEDTIAKIKNTSLDAARELDALIFLNRGAPQGGHTEPVKQLVAAAAAGKDVSAVAYTKSGAAFRREDIGSASNGEIALKDAEIQELRSAKRQLEIKIVGLESEIEELKTASKSLSVEQLLKLLESKIELTPKTRAALKDIRKALPRPQLKLAADKPTQAITTSSGATFHDEGFRNYRQMSLADLENLILTIQRAAGRGSHLTPTQWAKLDRMRARAAELKRNSAASAQGQEHTMTATA
jgi:hypothetical protein